MFYFDQTRSLAIRYEGAFVIDVGGLPMYTSAECRAQVEQKLAQAERDERHRKRLITAAEAWLFLASQLRRVEAPFPNDETVTTRDSKRRVKANVAAESV